MKKNNLLIFSVILAIFISCTTKENNETELKNNRSISMADSLYQVSAQYFNRYSAELIEITGQEGTLLKIPANSLVKEKNGTPYYGTCTIKLQEYYKLSDMLLGNLNTQTLDGQLLSSGGMVYIEVIDSNDQCLVMKENLGYEIQFPYQKKTSDKDMKLFYGTESDGLNLWEESDNSLFLTDQVWGLEDSITGTQNMYEGTVDHFIFNGTQFGWINCDAFVNFDNEQLLCKLVINDPIESYHRIIDKESMSIGVLYQTRRKDSYEFSKLQKGRDYWLLSMNTYKGDYFYDLKELTLSEKVNTVSPIYNKVDLKTLKAKMNQLN